MKGCELDTDGDGNCPVHPTGCPVTMNGLTLIRPWPWSIRSGGKRIENRKWRPRSVLGRRIALHAGLGWSDEGRDFIQAQGHENDAHGVACSRVREVNHPAACVVAVATVTGWIEQGARTTIYYGQRASINSPTLAGALFILGEGLRMPLPWVDQARWFMGPIGWLLEDVRPLTPITCKGGHGLWDVPRDVVDRITSQLAA